MGVFTSAGSIVKARLFKQIYENDIWFGFGVGLQSWDTNTPVSGSSYYRSLLNQGFPINDPEAVGEDSYEGCDVFGYDDTNHWTPVPDSLGSNSYSSYENGNPLGIVGLVKGMVQFVRTAEVSEVGAFRFGDSWWVTTNEETRYLMISGSVNPNQMFSESLVDQAVKIREIAVWIRDFPYENQIESVDSKTIDFMTARFNGNATYGGLGYGSVAMTNGFFYPSRVKLITHDNTNFSFTIGKTNNVTGCTGSVTYIDSLGNKYTENKAVSYSNSQPTPNSITLDHTPLNPSDLSIDLVWETNTDQVFNENNYKILIRDFIKAHIRVQNQVDRYGYIMEF